MEKIDEKMKEILEILASLNTSDIMAKKNIDSVSSFITIFLKTRFKEWEQIKEKCEKDTQSSVCVNLYKVYGNVPIIVNWKWSKKPSTIVSCAFSEETYPIPVEQSGRIFHPVISAERRNTIDKWLTSNGKSFEKALRVAGTELHIINEQLKVLIVEYNIHELKGCLK